MKRKIRVAIIGTGFGGEVHAPLLKHHPGFEVAAIASVYRSRPNRWKEQMGIPHLYTDWRKMMDQEKIDLVSVVSTPDLHHEMVLESFRRGYHVLCEKPMALTSAQSAEMVQAKIDAQRVGVTNFEWRMLPARQKVKQIFTEGILGRVLHINYTGLWGGYQKSTGQAIGWLGKKESGGGMLGALGSHMFDSLLWWTGERVTSVFAQLPTYIRDVTDAKGNREVRTAEDAFHTLGTLSNGTTFQASFIYPSRLGTGFQLEVFGTEGTLIMEHDHTVKVGIMEEKPTPIELPPTPTPPDTIKQPASSYYGAFYPYLDELHKTICTGEVSSNLATFQDGHRVQIILDAIRQSAETGQQIKISE